MEEKNQSKQVRLRISDKVDCTSYVNAFRTNVTPDELVVDLGMNVSVQASQSNQENSEAHIAGEIQFNITERVVMNYYTAKRLALMLGNVVRQHEQRFGELQLNMSDRVNNADNAPVSEDPTLETTS